MSGVDRKIPGKFFDKGGTLVNPMHPDFGAKGDGVTDDTEALRAAINFCKTYPFVFATSNVNPNHAKAATLFLPAGVFLVTEPLFLGMDDAGGETYENAMPNILGVPGAILYGKTNGKPVLDLSGAYGGRLAHFTMWGDDDEDTPNIGMLLASTVNRSAGAHVFVDIKFAGQFSFACAYNYGSEINKWLGCVLRNKAGKHGYFATSTNVNEAIESDFTELQQVYKSSYGDFFSLCDLRNGGDGEADQSVVTLESTSFGPSFDQCYFNPLSTSGPVVRMIAAGGASATQARSKNVRFDSCIVEGGSPSYDCFIEIDHVVRNLSIEKCTLVSSSPITADIKITANGDLRAFSIQKYRRNTNNEKVTYSNLGTIRYNRNTGTAVVANGATTIVVSHLMSDTPTAGQIKITPTNNLGNASHWWVSSITATQFTINVDSDPGATTATFEWSIDLEL